MAFELFQPAPMQAVWPGVATRVADPGGIDPEPTFKKTTDPGPAVKK